jgi:large subunit ribosomal protein L23
MTGRDPRDIIIKPVVSEKSYVAPDANKIEIRRAVEQIFNVRVTNVNTINRKGKRKRNRRSGEWSSRASEKRALVSLHHDDRIDVFGG